MTIRSEGMQFYLETINSRRMTGMIYPRRDGVAGYSAACTGIGWVYGNTPTSVLRAVITGFSLSLGYQIKRAGFVVRATQPSLVRL
jgi:hypothetical protein